MEDILHCDYIALETFACKYFSCKYYNLSEDTPHLQLEKY